MSGKSEAVERMEMNAAMDRQAAEQERRRPSVLFRPTLRQDGDQWCALYGKNLQEGCAGFGDTPKDAMRAFDENWRSQEAGVEGVDQ